MKVRAFSGSKINNMSSYIDPLLKKEPDYILLHVFTNDAPYKSLEFTEVLRLKSCIKNALPGVIVILSQPTMRIDNAKVAPSICDKLDNLNIYVLDNSNINENYLGRKGLHLNGRGTGRLAMNIMSHEACARITKESISDITVKSKLNPKSNIFTPKYPDSWGC